MMLSTVVTCPSCQKETYSDQTACPHCNAPLPTDADRRERIEAHQQALIDKSRESGDWSDTPAEIISRVASEIVLTTSFQVAGREIEHEIEIISAECVFGMNMFRDMFAAVRDVVGGRSRASQKVLRDARRTALTELRREALMVGADAVIAIDLDYQEFPGYKDGGMIMLVANGTAVKLA